MRLLTCNADVSPHSCANPSHRLPSLPLHPPTHTTHDPRISAHTKTLAIWLWFHVLWCHSEARRVKTKEDPDNRQLEHSTRSQRVPEQNPQGSAECSGPLTQCRGRLRVRKASASKSWWCCPKSSSPFELSASSILRVHPKVKETRVLSTDAQERRRQPFFLL